MWMSDFPDMTAFGAAVIAIRIGRYIASFVGASRTMMPRMVVQTLDTHRSQQVADQRKNNLHPAWSASILEPLAFPIRSPTKAKVKCKCN